MFCIIVHIIAMKQMNKKKKKIYIFLEVNNNSKLHIFSSLSGHHFMTCQPLDWMFCQSHEIYTDDAVITQTCDFTTCKEDSQTRGQCCFVQREEELVQKKRPLKRLQHR